MLPIFPLLNTVAWVEGNTPNAVDPSGNVSIPGNKLANVLNSSLCSSPPTQETDCSCYGLLRFLCPAILQPCGTEDTPPTLTPGELYEIWSEEVKDSVTEADTRSCLSFIVNREVVSDSPPTFLGSGIFDQARAITWSVLNNLALTKELDAGNRHGNNQRFVYCHPSDVSPCAGSAGYTSPNPEVERGINRALNNYRYRSSSDPTTGSLQWRHIPNEGWSDYNQNQILRIEGESVTTFFNRHQEAASRFMRDNPGRIYFDPQVRSVEEAEGYPYLSSLGTLAVFQPGSDTNGANLHDVLQFPQAGNIQPARNSCQR